MTISKFRALEHAAKELKDYCGNEHYYGTGDKPNFCDKCGAKMDLEQ